MEQKPRDQEETSYLIVHLVRGKPAFDIAIKIMIGKEEGWVIPTSGHRAYPYWYIPIRFQGENIHGVTWYVEGGINHVEFYLPHAPPSHPDHYAAPSQKPLTKLGQRDMIDLKLEDLEL